MVLLIGNNIINLYQLNSLKRYVATHKAVTCYVFRQSSACSVVVGVKKG